MRIFRERAFKSGDKNVYQYTLTNNRGVEVKILTLGGIITDILVPDKYGIKENIVVKWYSLTDYIDDDAYTGAIIGRTSGRIADGKANINGVEYKFNINNNTNQHHGGIEGFNKKVWKDTHVEDISSVSLILEYRSEDGEEGYPGNLDVKVTYSLNSSSEFTIEYYAKSDKDTLVNMTNHSYFNLSGDLKDSILDHTLKIKSSKVAKIKEGGALSGEVFNVENTPFDFRIPKVIKKDISQEDEQLQLANGYDHPWILDEGENCIVLRDERSGRIMEVSTDYKAAVIYTTNYPSDKVLFDKTKLYGKDAICFETQNLPIAEGSKFAEDSLLLKDKEYRHKTIFKFSTDL